MAQSSGRLPPPPFWRTRYFELEVMARRDRRDIDIADIQRAIAEPVRRQRQADGRQRLWYRVERRGKWLRVILEPDGETVHNAFWDRRFKP
jgi:hypothetical protein